MFRRLATIWIILSLAGLLAGCGNKWLTGKGNEEVQESDGEEPSESISVVMEESTYAVRESTLGHQGDSAAAAQDHTVKP